MELTELKKLIIDNKNSFENLLKENGCYGHLGDYKGKYDYNSLEIDEDGYIYIKSRIKDIFKTSTGEYVNAIPIEQELSKNKYIEFAVLISNNKKYTTALLFVDQEKYEQYKKTNNLTIEEYYNQTRIHQAIQKHIDILNNKLNKWEKIIKFKLITNSATIEGGELTPSMKVCREAIEVKYKDEIQSMY